MNMQAQLSSDDKALVASLSHRLMRTFSAEGDQMLLSFAGQTQLQRFFAHLPTRRQRELAIGTLVQFAFVLEKKYQSGPASDRLLALANSLLPQQ